MKTLRLTVSVILVGIVVFNACSIRKETRTANLVYDTTFSVYGPYSVIRLEITKGVRPSNPVQLAAGPGGVLYAANQTGEIYALTDSDNDGLEDTGVLYCNITDFSLRNPGGFAFRGDTIFIGTAQQIRAFRDTDNDGRADTSWVFFDDIPTSEHPYEWTSGVTFGPDGHLYVALATDSWNAGASPDPKGYRGAILRISPDGKKAERVATGIRSVYSMRFNDAGNLFFIDNEGGGNPDEELNLLIPGAFYGHNKKKYNADATTAPVHVLTTEMAPSGIVFNKGNNFGSTSGNLFVSFYGPGEHWTHGGVARVEINRSPDGKYTFNEFPVADIPKLSALAFGPDGSLYVAHHGKSDYWYNAVNPGEGAFYKIVYDPNARQQPVESRATFVGALDETSVQRGKQIFAERACAGCHGVDGQTELLGPNLNGIARQLSREEILLEIQDPSAKIKPSMMAVRVQLKDGKILLGRTINADKEHIDVMVVGNHVVRVARDQIAKAEDDTKSLMYDGLINGLPDADREALLDYILSLDR